MTVISDTSALTNLIKIEQLEILEEVFETIIIPNAVYEELAQVPINKEIIELEDWISTQEISDRDFFNELIQVLDKGESEAIALARELEPDYLLIDEKRGRQIAEQYKIKKIGIIGVLIRAKQKSLLENVKPTLDLLIEKADFFISDQLYRDVLYQQNEL